MAGPSYDTGPAVSKRLMRHALAILALAVLLPSRPALADALRLASGEVLVGQIVRRSAKEIVFRKSDGTESTFALEQVGQVITGDTYKSYLEKREKAASREERAALAKWCSDHDLKPEWTALSEALLKEAPADDKLRRAMGFVKIEGAWVAPDVVAAMQRAPYPQDIVWSLEWDCGEADWEAWKEIVRKSAAHLWKATEGQIWLRSVKMADRARASGEVWVDASAEHPMTGAGQVHLAKGWYPEGQHFTFVHAWGHAFLDLGDEYVKDGQPANLKTEPKCVMGTSSFAGFCDKSTHEWPGPDCWSKIQKKMKKLRHPNPFPPDAPPVRIEVQDK